MPWTVGDVMTKDVVTVGVDTDFKTCVDWLRVRRGVVGVDNTLSFRLDDTHAQCGVGTNGT